MSRELIIMEKPEKLKVGDKVCQVTYSRWDNDVYYIFEDVERLTKTQAILKNGTKLINDATNSWGSGYSFMTYGDRYSRWNITTPEIIEAYTIEKERQKINSWFNKQKDLFTYEQKKQIFNLFN